MSKRHKRHKNGESQEEEREVKTVARQHTTSVGIQQDIQVWRFLSPGLQ